MPRLSPNPVQDCLPASSPSIQKSQQSVHFLVLCHSATVPTTSVIPGLLRFKARRIGWHPSGTPAAKPAPLKRVLSRHRLTGDRPSIIAPGRVVPFDANSSATQVSCWRFPPSPLTSLSAGRSPRQVSLPDQAEYFPAPRSTGVLCSSSWSYAWFRYGIVKLLILTTSGKIPDAAAGHPSW